MSHGEIKAIITSPIIMVLKLVKKPSSCSEIPKSYIRYGKRSTTIRLRRSKAASQWRKKNTAPMKS